MAILYIYTMTYTTALKELQEITTELENEQVGIDELSSKIKRAAELIQFCKEKLRNVEGEVEDLLDNNNLG